MNTMTLSDHDHAERMAETEVNCASHLYTGALKTWECDSTDANQTSLIGTRSAYYNALDTLESVRAARHNAYHPN